MSLPALAAFAPAHGEEPLHYLTPTPGGVYVFDGRAEAGIVMRNPIPVDLALLKPYHIRFVRLDLAWSDLEPTDRSAEEAVAAWDRRINLLTQEGFIPVLRVTGKGMLDGGPDGRVAFAEFLRILAQRWPKVRYWEVWPYMDEDPFFAPTPAATPEERAVEAFELLKLCYPGLKAVNGDAVFILGAPRAPERFLPYLYAAGARDYFNIVAVETLTPPMIDLFLDRARRVRAAMIDAGDEFKPLWNVGVGVDGATLWRMYGPPREGVDAGLWLDTYQAAEMSTAVADAMESGAYHRFFLYAWNVEEGAGEPPENPPELPEGRTFADYGFSLKRAQTVRPFMEWFAENNVNDPERLGTPSRADLELSADRRAVSLEIGSAYPARAVLPPLDGAPRRTPATDN